MSVPPNPYLSPGRLRGSGCSTFVDDMRMQVRATGLYTYPDVAVVCGEQRFGDDVNDTLLNPAILFEVLSPSTEAYDRGRKFEHYRSIESLREYVLVTQDRISVGKFTRQESGLWLLQEWHSLDDLLPLDSLGADIPGIPLADIISTPT